MTVWKAESREMIWILNKSRQGGSFRYTHRYKLHGLFKTHPRWRHSPSKLEEPTENATQTKDAFKDRVVSVLGPSWVWTYGHYLTTPLRAYNRAQDKRPYLAQICTSLTIYFMGDLSSQLIESAYLDDSQSNQPSTNSMTATKSPENELVKRQVFTYNPERSLCAMVIGGVFSIPSLHWFLFLSRNFNVPHSVPYSTMWSLLIKIVVNQAVFTPAFNTYFFGMQSLLSSTPGSETKTGAPVGQTLSLTYAQAKLEAAWDRVKSTVPITWYNSCKFWPFVTAFSFTFVQPQSRSAFAGVVAVGWQSYLGIVNQRAAAKSRRKAREEA